MTQQSVDIHWQRWAEYISKVRKLAAWAGVDDDRESAWARRKKPHQPIRDVLMADVFKSGLFVGELRPDGSVNPVRRQAAPTSRGVNTLSARTCKKCLDYLPVSRFSKQGKSTRAICKVCDNARRVARRKA